MGSRIVIGGRVLGGGTGVVTCLCGEPASILGRCDPCHKALVRRRQGLPPADKQEAKRLAGFLEKHQAAHQRCHECGATSAPRCLRCDSMNVDQAILRCRDCGAAAQSGDHDPRCRYAGM